MKRMNYCTLNNMDKSQNHAEWKDPDKKRAYCMMIPLYNYIKLYKILYIV